MKNTPSQVQADNKELSAKSSELVKDQPNAKTAAKVASQSARKAAAKETLLNKKKFETEQEQQASQDVSTEERSALVAEDRSAQAAEPTLLLAQADSKVISDAGSGVTATAPAGAMPTPSEVLSQVGSAFSAAADGVSSTLSGLMPYVTPLNTAMAVGGFTALHQLTSGSGSASGAAPVGPVFQSLAVHSNGGGAGSGTLVLNYDLALDAAHAPDGSKFTVLINGVANMVDSVVVSGSTVTLTLHDAVPTGSLSVSVAYADPTTGNDVNAIQDTSGNDAASITIVSGVVADGHIRGASVYIDTNNDGLATSADYFVGTTDGDGRFFISSKAPSGKLVVTGGVNTDTGIPNTMTLKAPAPDLSKPLAINPLTTVITSVMSSAVTAAQAAAKVASAFGLTLPPGKDLLSIDPITAANDISTASFGLPAQKVAAQVATIVKLASSDNSAVTGAAAKVIDNLAAAVNSVNAQAPTLNLSSASTLTAVLNGAVSSTAVSTLTAIGSTLISAVAAIQAASSVDNVSSAQSQYLDTIAPFAPTSVVVAAVTNDTTPEVTVNLNVTDLAGHAAVKGNTVELYEGATLLASVVLTAQNIADGYVKLSPEAANALSAQAEHTLSAKIKDNAGTPNVSEAATANVVAVDTVNPVFSSGATATKNENVASGTLVYTASATDTHSLTYSLKAGDDAAAFNINATTGEVTLKVSPDFETNPSYRFTVVATDAGGNATEKPVTLTINNLDEVAPTITSADTATAVNENVAAGAVVYTATSTDTGDIATGSTTYSLKANTGDAAAFAIDANSGAVTLVGSPNFEVKSSYSFTVVATDAAGNISQKPVTLAINDVNEAPTAVVLTSVLVNNKVAENTATTNRLKVADIAITDDALGSETITLTGNDAIYFEVDAGVLYLKAGTVLDFETKTSYTATVNVVDSALNGSTPVAASYTLSVTDVNEAPTVANAIADKVFVVGGAVDTYQVPSNSFSDVDTNTTLTYSATLSNGSALPSWLAFDAATRTFSGNPTSNGTLTVRVTASDGALTVYDDFVLTSVTAPVVQSFTVTDDTVSNGNTNTLGKSGEALTFVVTLSEPVTTTGSLTAHFSVNGHDVTATAAAVSGASTLTFTGASVPALGDGTAISLTSLESTAAITGDTSHQPLVAPIAGAVTYAGYTVDNTAPVVTSATISMPENSTAGVALTATDAGAVTWTKGAGDDTALFDLIDGTLNFVAAKNYEADPHAYSVNVVATDAAGNVKNQAVTVNLTNVNEAPSISSGTSATFAENGTGTVYTTVASDSDANTTLAYTIAGADAALFNISNTGVVTFKAAPNFEAPVDAGANNVYDIIVNTTDGALSATKAVEITVTNVNEAPVISSSATASFAENGTGAAYTTAATDPDASTMLTYSLGGADAAKFSISNTGVVTFITAPNFEAPTDTGANNVYDIVVNTTDGLLSVSKDVAVTVTNVNEAPVVTPTDIADVAVIAGTSYTTSSPIYLDGISSLISSYFTDPEAASLTYSLGAGKPAWLNIDASTGKLYGNVSATASADLPVTVNVFDGLNTVSKSFRIDVVDMPKIVNATVLDGQASLDVTSNLVFKFDQPINAINSNGSKYIRIINDANGVGADGVSAKDGYKGEDAGVDILIDVTDSSQVTVSGDGLTVTVNPTADLDISNNYHVQVDAGAFVSRATGMNSVGISDATTINFSTVTPADSTVSINAITSAALSRVVNADGLSLTDGKYWVDIEDRSNPQSAPQQINAGTSAANKDFAFVFKDYDHTTADAATSNPGITTDDFFVRLYNFGYGDLLYVDSKTSDVNLINLTSFTGSGLDTLSGAGTRWKGIVLAGTTVTNGTEVTTGGGLGGQINISLLPSADTPSDSTVAVNYTTLSTLLSNDPGYHNFVIG